MNNWNADVAVPGHANIKGMMQVCGSTKRWTVTDVRNLQPRFLNGTFNFTDPRHCSVNDPLMSTCFLNAVNKDGFYESSPIVVSPNVYIYEFRDPYTPCSHQYSQASNI